MTASHDVAGDDAVVQRRIGDRAGRVDPGPDRASLARAGHGEHLAGPGRLPGRLPAGRHPGSLHGRVRVGGSDRRGIAQQDGGDLVVDRPLDLSPVQGVMIGPPAGRDRGGGYRQHGQDDHDQPQGALDPVRAPS